MGRVQDVTVPSDGVRQACSLMRPTKKQLSVISVREDDWLRGHDFYNNLKRCYTDIMLMLQILYRRKLIIRNCRFPSFFMSKLIK